jgi:hypothetical protein
VNAHIYRGSRDPHPSLGVGFDDFLATLTSDDPCGEGDRVLAAHGWTRTGAWSDHTPRSPLTGLYTAPIRDVA